MDRLEAYLEQQHQAGKTESQGEFTVAFESARLKLDKFQLANPAFYLLKVFQAAVASGTSRIDLELGRTRLSMRFGTETPAFSIQQLIEGLRNVLGLAPSPLRHMAVGINASLATNPVQVALVWWRGRRGEGAALDVRDGQVSLAAPPPRPSLMWDTAENLYIFQVTKRTAGFGAPSSMAQEHAAVYQRCGYSPVDVFLDGRPLRSRWRCKSRAGWLSELSRPFLLVERVTADPDGPIALAAPPLDTCYSQGRDEVSWIRTSRIQETYLFQGDCRPSRRLVSCRAAYTIPVSLQCGSADTVFFMRDGVLLDAHTVRTQGMGAVAILPADGLSVDLSEFQVIVDRACERAVEQVKTVWTEMLEAVSSSLGGLTAIPVGEDENRFLWRNGLGTLGLIAGGTLAFISPPCGLLGGALLGVAGFAVPSLWHPHGDDAHFRMAVEVRIKGLLEALHQEGG